jgi:hypothetical protein
MQGDHQKARAETAQKHRARAIIAWLQLQKLCLGSFEVKNANSQPLYIAWSQNSMNAFAYNSWILVVFLSKRRSRTMERNKTVRKNIGEVARHGIMQTDYEMQLKIALNLGCV